MKQIDFISAMKIATGVFDQYDEESRASIEQGRQDAQIALEEVKDAILKEMVNRFLCWPLPKTFYPDCGISFDGRKDDEWNKNKTWPIGTNLLTADEAKAMFIHCLNRQ